MRNAVFLEEANAELYKTSAVCRRVTREVLFLRGGYLTLTPQKCFAEGLSQSGTGFFTKVVSKSTVSFAGKFSQENNKVPLLFSAAPKVTCGFTPAREGSTLALGSCSRDPGTRRPGHWTPAGPARSCLRSPVQAQAQAQHGLRKRSLSIAGRDRPYLPLSSQQPGRRTATFPLLRGGNWDSEVVYG